MSDIKNSDFTPTTDPSAPSPPAEATQFEVSDLTETVVETLGSYMLSLTEANYYHPEAPVEQSSPDDPAVLGTQELSDIAAGGSSSGFFAGVQAAAAAYYATITDGSTPDATGGGTLGPLTDFLDKNNQQDGHDLLGQVVGDTWSEVWKSEPNTSDPGQDVRDKISDVLKYNRFSPGSESPYIQDNLYSNGMFSIQNTLGRYNEDAESAAFDELAKIGFSLMLTATGASDDDSNPDSADSTNAIGQGIDVQLALSKVNTSALQTKYAHGHPDATGGVVETFIYQDGIKRKGATTEDQDAKNAKSYGQLNSYLEPFDGPLPVGMIVLAVIAAVAVLIAGIVLAAILTLIFLVFPPGQVEEPPEPLPMGAAAGQPDFGKLTIGKWLMKMLRIPIIRSGKTFLAAMFFGVLQFYFRILDAISSGFFIIVSRAAIRDLEQISDALADADFSNVVGGLESIFVVLDAFATSTTFQFLNTLAMLGDIVLMSGGLGGGGSMEFSPYDSADGQPDVLPPALANLHLKSRTLMDDVDPDYRLAWRFGSMPSRYLLPPNVLASNAAMGFNEAFGAAGRMPKGWGAFGEKTSKFGAKARDKGATDSPSDDIPARLLSGRYSADDRQAFEDELNAYYIPFYLHDLRTNEILAMHTFIDNFTDSFAPEWSNMGGFGRMDDVMIYKKTKRTMGLSFWMIATGPEDQEELYFAINKLVSMVYPQWSKGTLKKDDNDNSFIMPFSQVPTASPLVRLRVGDLWSSNYSIQNISRMFGLGTSSFLAEGNPPYLGGESDQKDIDGKIAEILEHLDSMTPQGNGAPPYAEALASNTSVLGGGLIPVGVTSGFAVGAKVIINPSRYKKCEFEAAAVNFKKTSGKVKVPASQESDRKGTVAGYIIRPIVDVSSGEEDSKRDTRRKKKARVRYAVLVEPAGPLAEAFDDPTKQCLICGDGDLIFDYPSNTLEAINAILGSPTVGGIPDPFAEPAEPTLFTADDLKDFFGTAEGDISGNSIIRAFHESGGKGIAGAITNLDFDWNVAPWDERPGSRAPTYVKVTMGFAPIHDIPLGMDHAGGLRAPAYNVGGIVRGLFGSGHSLAAEANTKAVLTEALKKLLPPPPAEEAIPTGTEEPGT